jgi:hypothetical protein
MRTLVMIVMAASALCGCANITQQLDNRVVCTASKDQGYIVSLYGAFGISTTLNKDDSKKLCSLPATP